MPKVVRLSSREQREWSNNIPQLVDKRGVPQSAVSKVVEAQCGKLASQAHKLEKGSKKVFRYRDENKKDHRVEIECKVKRYGQGKGELRVFTYVDGMLKVSTREVMRARFFKRHGECMLKRTNGTFLTMVRDPKPKHSTNMVVATDTHLRHTPDPEACQCKDWGGRQKGRHHIICRYNAMAPPHQRGYQAGDPPPDGERKAYVPEPTPEPRELDAVEERQRLDLEAAGGSVTKHAVKEKVESEPPPPEECEICKGWARTHKNKHHPTCEHYVAWEMRNKPKMFIVEPETGTMVREASADEIAEAEVERKRTGFGLIQVSGTPFAVMAEKDLPASGSAVDDVEEEVPETERPTEDALPIEMPSDEELGETEPEPEAPIGAGLDASIDEGGLPIPGLED